ncbi:MAG: hypothetical protein LUE27_07190 [Clostridia bacterium]|nr:hypothetical protein [Clostridia bacterium]
MKFSEKELEFLKNEFGYTENQIDNFSEDELSDLTDECFDIEVDEVVAADDGNGDVSERGETAADIVTKLTAKKR